MLTSLLNVVLNVLRTKEAEAVFWSYFSPALDFSESPSLITAFKSQVEHLSKDSLETFPSL